MGGFEAAVLLLVFDSAVETLDSVGGEAAVIARIQCTAVEGDLGPSAAVGLGLSSGGLGPSEGRLLWTQWMEVAQSQR